jgi:hypothetical protein
MGNKYTQNVVVIQALARKSQYLSAFPIHNIAIEIQRGECALVRTTFAVDHVFSSELSDLLKAMGPRLAKIDITVITSNRPFIIEFDCVEAIGCLMQYHGIKDLANLTTATNFINQLAAFLGSPSMANPTYGRKVIEQPYFQEELALA